MLVSRGRSLMEGTGTPDMASDLVNSVDLDDIVKVTDAHS